VKWFRDLPRNIQTTILVAAVGLACLVVGWWVGGFMACISSTGGCQVRWESVTALGTWFGAIGTILAFVIAAQAFRADQSARDRAEARASETKAERTEREQREAARVVAAVAWLSSQGVADKGGGEQLVRASTLRLVLTNGSGEPARNVAVTSEDFPGWRFSKLQVAASDREQAEIRSRGEGWEVPRDQRRVAAKFADGLTIGFDMFGHRWEKRGQGPTERVTV
jgi:hypothetical protein